MESIIYAKTKYILIFIRLNSLYNFKALLNVSNPDSYYNQFKVFI